MSSITTITVGANAQPLSPGPVAGATADTVTIVNLDTAASVNLGSQSSQLNLMLGPLASVTLTAPVWAAAVTTDLKIGVLPGGSNYSPGSLTITGPVTATITGPVDANVTGTVAISSGTVDATVTGTVDIAAGSVTFTNDTIDVIGDGGYILPGAYTQVLNDSTTHALTTSGGVPIPYVTPIQSVQDFQSYSLSVTAYNPGQASVGAALLMPIQINWYADAGGTQLLEIDTLWMWLANSAPGAATSPLLGGGPARGAYVSLSFFNQGNGTVNVTQISLSGNGRALGGSRFFQYPPNMTSGITRFPSINPAGNLPEYPNGSDGVLVNESANGSGNASSTYWFPLPLYSGQISCRFSTNVALANDFVLCTAAGLTNGSVAAGSAAQGIIWNPGNAAATDYTTTLQIGSCPLYAVIHTTATAPVITLEVQGSVP